VCRTLKKGYDFLNDYDKIKAVLFIYIGDGVRRNCRKADDSYQLALVGVYSFLGKMLMI